MISETGRNAGIDQRTPDAINRLLYPVWGQRTPDAINRMLYPCGVSELVGHQAGNRRARVIYAAG
jgi:hypothetical protein